MTAARGVGDSKVFSFSKAEIGAEDIGVGKQRGDAEVAAIVGDGCEATRSGAGPAERNPFAALVFMKEGDEDAAGGGLVVEGDGSADCGSALELDVGVGGGVLLDGDLGERLLDEVADLVGGFVELLFE